MVGECKNGWVRGCVFWAQFWDQEMYPPWSYFLKPKTACNIYIKCTQSIPFHYTYLNIYFFTIHFFVCIYFFSLLDEISFLFLVPVLSYEQTNGYIPFQALLLFTILFYYCFAFCSNTEKMRPLRLSSGGISISWVKKLYAFLVLS